MRSRRSIQTILSSSWWASTAIALALLVTVSSMVQAQNATDEGVMEIVVLPAGSSVSAPEPMSAAAKPAFPGTLTAAIALIEPSARDSDPGVMQMTLVVSDERGTASGWAVNLMAVTHSGAEPAPILLENRTDSIRSILPNPAAQSEHVRGVISGRTLGPLQSPLLVLHADAGNGAGVFSQQLLVDFGPLPQSPSGRLFVQLPFAP